MLITFEGIDGSGKSTVLEMVAANLNERGYDVLITKEPGGTKLGMKLREVLLDKEIDLDPETEMELFILDRKQHLKEIIIPAMKDKKIILCDRFYDSNIAYQSQNKEKFEINKKRMEELFKNIIIDKSILFKIDYKTSVERIKTRGGDKDKMDSMKKEEKEYIIKNYDKIAKLNKERYSVINAEENLGSVYKNTIKIINEIIKKTP